MHSWRVLQSSPWTAPTPVYAIARTPHASPHTPPQAYTLDTRVNRVPADLVRVLGEDSARKWTVNEIVEGLVLFEDEEHAAIFADLVNEPGQTHDLFSVNGPDAVEAMQNANGVIVLVDEPVVPAYLQERLLSIAYDVEEKN